VNVDAWRDALAALAAVPADKLRSGGDGSGCGGGGGDGGDVDIVAVAVAAVSALSSRLSGIGPATASALVAAHAPALCPFMSDEAVEGCGLPRKYDLPTYSALAQRLQTKARGLGPEWTAELVGRALWTAATAHAHGIEVTGPPLSNNLPANLPANLPDNPPYSLADNLADKVPSERPTNPPKGQSGTLVTSPVDLSAIVKPKAKTENAAPVVSTARASTRLKRRRAVSQCA